MSLILVANLSPVSTKPAVLVAKFVAGVVETGDALDMRISPRIFKKIQMTLMLFSGAWGKMIHEKNLKQKISWHCPFKDSIGAILYWPLGRPEQNSRFVR